MTDILTDLPARSPRRLLQELSDLAGQLARAGRPRPEVALALANGLTLRGRLVRLADERDGAVVMLHVDGRLDAPAVAFARADQVVAVTMIDASLLVRAAQSDEPVPTKLELARRVAAQQEVLTSRLGRAVRIEVAGELDDDARRAIATLLPVAVSVLCTIAGDEMGKEAVDAIDSLELRADAQRTVERNGKKLVITASRVAVEPFEADALHQRLERVL